MNKLTTLLILAALMLPVSAHAQPQDGSRERPNRAEQRDPERNDRPGERFRPEERDGDRDRPSKREPLSVEQLDEALATLRAMNGEANPAWLERIENQAKENPEEAARRISRFPRIREMMEARKHHPDEFALQSKQGQLMREVFPMVREVREAQANDDQDKVNELTPQIRERIKQLFEIRMAMKEIEIKQIREKLARAEKELGEIQADRESLIDEKMNDILAGKGPRGPREGFERGENELDARPKPDRNDRE